jgi:hypothetical protein
MRAVKLILLGEEFALRHSRLFFDASRIKCPSGTPVSNVTLYPRQQLSLFHAIKLLSNSYVTYRYFTLHSTHNKHTMTQKLRSLATQQMLKQKELAFITLSQVQV